MRVVVTGASAGLGRAAVFEFARRGASVGLLARDSERLEAAAAEVKKAGGQALVLPADVADSDAVDAAAVRAVAEWGAIDVWVNCAMATVFGLLREITVEEFRRVTEVTYFGYVHGTLAALRHMLPRDSGTIVQVGSALAYRAIPLQAAYCGAKFAIRGFTDALRSELLHDGSHVRLSMVQMPALNTPQFDWGRNKLPKRPRPVPPIYQPEAGARAIVRAAVEAPRELWVGRTSVKAIVGNMIAPALLDGLLAKSGYRSQMSNEPAIGGAPDNLFAPVQGPFGAHGRFDTSASRGAVAIHPDAARKALGLFILAAASASVIYLVRRRLGQPRTPRRRLAACVRTALTHSLGPP